MQILTKTRRKNILNTLLNNCTEIKQNCILYLSFLSSDKANEDEIEDFKMEINFMKTIGLHENVVTMLGCCTLYPPLCLVVEYVPHGDLLHYLRDLRKAVRTRHSSHASCILPALNVRKLYADVARFEMFPRIQQPIRDNKKPTIDTAKIF